MSKVKSKKKIMVIVSCVCVGLAVFVVVWLMICGYLWTWGPFSSMANIRFKNLAGNSDIYSVENVEEFENSPLEGMNICYLGSSVTYGASSLQTSFVEYIAKRNNTTYVKEAVSGTTLVDAGINSYISRMEKLDKGAKFDLFVCQLSTNDATQSKTVGSVSAEGTTEFDTSTVCGAIEYIIAYVSDTWDCPIVFYTNSYYESETYAAMVETLDEIGQKYEIGIIDLYTDEKFNDITEEQRTLYMADDIHPTKAGYLEWWTPKMEGFLYQFVGEWNESDQS